MRISSRFTPPTVASACTQFTLINTDSPVVGAPEGQARGHNPRRSAGSSRSHEHGPEVQTACVTLTRAGTGSAVQRLSGVGMHAGTWPCEGMCLQSSLPGSLPRPAPHVVGEVIRQEVHRASLAQGPVFHILKECFHTPTKTPFAHTHTLSAPACQHCVTHTFMFMPLHKKSLL
jgi:hypothetical protein